MTSINNDQTTTVDPDMKMQSIDLNAWFGQKQALKNVNIGIKTNSVTAIIGPSGCGKSTFIRCLNRMHELTPNAKMTGQVLLDLSLIHISEPTRLLSISYAVFCLKKKT